MYEDDRLECEAKKLEDAIKIIIRIGEEFKSLAEVLNEQVVKMANDLRIIEYEKEKFIESSFKKKSKKVKNWERKRFYER